MTASRGHAAPAAPWATTGVAIAALVALGYFVLIGGGAFGELQPVPRLIGAILSGAFVVAYLMWAGTRADRLDKAALLALLAFAVASILSQFPRQSLDALIGALAWSAGLFVARGLSAEERCRRWFVNTMIGLSGLLTLSTVARWLPQVLETMTVSGSGLPPLNLELSATPWGHRYDLALLVAILYPAWWIGRPSPLRRTAALVVGVLVLFIVLITGSRTLWAALGIASSFLAVPFLSRSWHGAARLRLPITIAVVAIGVALAVSGVGALIAQRALSLETLAFRTAMWGSLIDAWVAHPLAGFGPGSFPWALQLTGYFDVNSFAPRHPDNALIQQLVEGGVLGVLALLVIVAAVLPAVVRGRSTAARWAVIAFAIMCLGGNPSDFAFVVVVILAWVAYATPRHEPAELRDRAASGPTRAATLAMFAVIVAVSGAVHLAAFSYERARTAIAHGDDPAAERAMDLAVALDPGMALYVRQRGALAYVEGDLATAGSELERATKLNPADDLAWRSLALAYFGGGRREASQSALSRAVTLQRSDATNLLLSAQFAGAQGRTADAIELLAEVVQSWPAIVGAPGWSELLPSSVTTEEVVDAAAARWETGQPTPEVQTDQSLWLAALADRPDLEVRAIAEAGLGQILGETIIAVTRCDPEALNVLDRASEADRRQPLYAVLRERAESLASGTAEPTSAATTLNPLDENGFFSADAWGYRRQPITWPASVAGLPSPIEGLTRWIRSSREAARAAQLDGRLPLCQSSP